jgi:hypothetical protein
MDKYDEQGHFHITFKFKEHIIFLYLRIIVSENSLDEYGWLHTSDLG